MKRHLGHNSLLMIQSPPTPVCLPDGAFDALRWHRLRLELRNVRWHDGAGAHPYSVVEAMLKGVRGRGGTGQALFHVRDRHADTLHAYQGYRLPIEICLFGLSDAQAVSWHRLLLEQIRDDGNFQVDDGVASPIPRDLAEAWKEAGITSIPEEVALEFLSPLPFRSGTGWRAPITASEFFSDLRERVIRLFGVELAPIDTAGVAVIPWYLRFKTLIHRSDSNKTQALSKPESGIMWIKGGMGPLTFRGDLAPILPLLVLASEMHAGREVSFGRGYCRLLMPPIANLMPQLADVDALAREARRVVEESPEDAARLALRSDGLLMDMQLLASRLAAELATGHFVPAPNEAYLQPKSDGRQRLVEIVPVRERIVHRHLASILDTIVDRLLEPTVIGYRKGKSREDAAALIDAAVREGFAFVVKADVRDFFPSVDLDRLGEQLETLLVMADRPFVSLLLRLLKSGYTLDGIPHDRPRGLMQGSPLAPLLANLYLDPLDKAMAGPERRLVRYGDDFVVLARSEGDARAALEHSRQVLGNLGLCLNEDKVNVGAVAEGFCFLGMRLVQGKAELRFTPPLTKPLYITQSYVALGVEGEALVVRRFGEILDRFPLLRISEVILLSPAVVSTALLRRCARARIPVVLLLGSGYHVQTIHPDSRAHFAHAHRQAMRWEGMSQGERLAVAREWVVAKIRNQENLLVSHYERGTAGLMKRMERLCRLTCGVAQTDQLRGLEGAAARIYFRRFSELLRVPYFAFAGRMPRAPDAMNGLLDFVYHLLFSRINATLRALGLNPYLGFLHEGADGYEALAWDAMEPFRPTVDRLVLRMINERMLQEGDFELTGRGMRLQASARQKVIESFEKELRKSPTGNPLSFADGIYAQCVNLRDHMLDGASFTAYRWRPDTETRGI